MQRAYFPVFFPFTLFFLSKKKKSAKSFMDLVCARFQNQSSLILQPIENVSPSGKDNRENRKCNCRVRILSAYRRSCRG